MKVTQSCLTLCNPMDYTVHGILQARILEWVAFPFSRWSSQPRDRTQVSGIVGRFFTSWATALQAVLLCWSQRPESSYLKENGRTSLVIQWIKIRLPMQGTCVQPLVWEGGCHRGIKTASHNCWSPCAWSLCSETREAATRRSPRTTTRE